MLNYPKVGIILRYKLYLIFIFFINWLSAQNTVIKNIEYGNHNKQKLDIFTSLNDGCNPVIIYIHGGFWSDGDKRATYCKDELFTNNGFVLVSINYRLAPKNKFPDNINDIAKAIAWVYNNIDRYGGDPDNINLIGFSAGAHLAALVSTDQTYLESEGFNLECINNVILVDGSAYNIPMYIEKYVKPNGIIFGYYVDAFGSMNNFYKASPIKHISPDKNIPNMLLIHNNEKSRKYISHNFGEALELNGVNVVYLNAGNFKHGQMDVFIGNDSYNEYSLTILKFLENEKTNLR